MSGPTYTGPGWYRVRDVGPGVPPGSTRVVWIGPKRDPLYAPDWRAIWATSDDRSAVICEGLRDGIASMIVERIETEAVQ